MTRFLASGVASMACALLATAASAQLAGPGISAELARHRAGTISDVAYNLEFRIPADRAAPVTGAVDIRLVRHDDGPLILDFARPDGVRSMTVNGADHRVRSENNHLVVDTPALRPGENRIRIEFEAGDGPLNRHEDFLYTLFVPDRAHEAFPSFDQPDMKSRFTLQLTVPAQWVAVSNGQVVERRDSGDEVVYRFAETQPLASYFFSFAAGRFHVETAERSGRAMRLFHRETDSTTVARNLGAIFDLHASALAWLEEYTEIPYPYGKFDLVAVPSFQYNGMEHPGAILYRVSSLFLDPAATRAQELGRASLIAHETAHMWFGDLVTMTWFDDVWMKEVFANFMAAKIVNPSFPDVDHDLRFFLAHHPAAYAVDRTPGANPIRQPLANLDDAASLYGAIIYQKAPIVMRQLERLTGESAFRQAVRRYLSGHAHGNAAWTDLVAYLDEVTNLDVPAWSRVWVEEPGRPTIRAVREDSGVTLVQFDPRGRGLLWDQLLDVAVVDASPRIQETVRLAGERTTLSPPAALAAGDGAILPDADGGGYGLFMLDATTRSSLLSSLPSLARPLDRAVAWITLHELLLQGSLDAVAMLDLAAATVERETDELLTQTVTDHMVDLFWTWVSAADRNARARTLERLLWDRAHAVQAPSHKATFFDGWRALASTPEALVRMERVWDGSDSIPGLPLAERDLTALALNLALHRHPDATRILDAQATRIENPDRRARFDFIRRAVDPDPDVRDAFFASLADPRSRHREEWVVAALRFLHHPRHPDEALPRVRPALDLLVEVRETGDIFFPQRWLDAVLSGHSSPAAADLVRKFIEAQRNYPPRLMEKLLQAADPLFRKAAAAR
jgi:aminopeptidase N